MSLMVNLFFEQLRAEWFHPILPHFLHWLRMTICLLLLCFFLCSNRWSNVGIDFRWNTCRNKRIRGESIFCEHSVYGVDGCWYPSWSSAGSRKVVLLHRNADPATMRDESWRKRRRRSRTPSRLKLPLRHCTLPLSDVHFSRGISLSHSPGLSCF